MGLEVQIINRPHVFFSLQEPSPLDRAAKSAFSLLDDENKKRAIGAIYKQAMRLANTTQCGKPVIIVFDNNILDSIRKISLNDEHKINAACAIGFMDFLVNYSKIDVMVSLAPTILYEYAGKKTFSGRKEFEACYRSLLILLGQFNVPVWVVGVTNYKNARRIIADIRSDEREILRAINIINNSKWDEDLQGEDGSIRIPFAFAARKIPSMRLRYLKRYYVEYLLAHKIEGLIYKAAKKCPKVRKLINSKNAEVFSRLSTKKGASLKGLGDIELLSLCDLRAQFGNGEQIMRFALTFDEDLQYVLHEHSNLVLRSPAMSLSEGIPMIHEFIRQSNRSSDEWDRNLEKYGKALDVYLTYLLGSNF